MMMHAPHVIYISDLMRKRRICTLPFCDGSILSILHSRRHLSVFYTGEDISNNYIFKYVFSFIILFWFMPRCYARNIGKKTNTPFFLRFYFTVIQWRCMQHYVITRIDQLSWFYEKTKDLLSGKAQIWYYVQTTSRNNCLSSFFIKNDQ